MPRCEAIVYDHNHNHNQKLGRQHVLMGPGSDQCPKKLHIYIYIDKNSYKINVRPYSQLDVMKMIVDGSLQFYWLGVGSIP